MNTKILLGIADIVEAGANNLTMEDLRKLMSRSIFDSSEQMNNLNYPELWPAKLKIEYFNGRGPRNKAIANAIRTFVKNPW